MPLGAAQAQERNSCDILLAPSPAGGRRPGRGGREAGDAGRPGTRGGRRPGGAGCPGARRARSAPRCVPAAPGLRSAASRSRTSARRPAGDDARRPVPTRGARPRGAAGEPGRGAGNRGANARGRRAGRQRGAERRGAAHPGRSGAERPGGGGAAWPPLLPSSAFPLPPPRGRRPAPCGGGARRWSRCPRPPPAGGAGRARERGSAGRGGGGQRRRGRDSRTLHLQVHLAHLGEPVAQIHGKLLDHCGHTEGRGSGERRREGGRKSVSQSLARRRGGGGRRLFAAASPPAPLHRPCPAARLPRPAHTHSPDSPPDTAWRRPGQRQGASR